MACGCTKRKLRAAAKPNAAVRVTTTKYIVTLEDGTEEEYGSRIPANRRALRTGGVLSTREVESSFV